MQIVNLNLNRLFEMEQVFCEALGVPPKGEGDDTLWGYFDADRSWLAIDDESHVIGLANGFATQLALPGGEVVCGGAVPWFGVRVGHHGKGIGRALIEHQLNDASSRGDAFLALNSSQYPIYGRYGYGPTGRWWSVKIDVRRVRWHSNAPVADRVTIGHAPEVHDELVDCYTRSFGEWPGEVARHPGHWQRRLAPRSDDKGRRLWALLRDENNTVVAAAYYSVEEHFDDTGFANRLTVNDLFGVNECSQIALWRWLMSLPLVGEVSCDRMDPGSALIHAMEDPRLLITTGMSDTTWLRILDIRRVLGGRATMSTGTVVIQVLDPVIEALSGTWQLTGDGEQLSIEPSQDSPEITVDVGLLASLTFAHDTASGLAAAGQLIGQPAALARLDRLLAWPRLAWSSHMF